MRKSFFVFTLFTTVLMASALACTDAVPAELPTPTGISPGEIAGTAIQQYAAAEATKFSVDIRFTATAQVVAATQAAQQVVINAESTQQARRDAQATSEQARRDAEATSEQKRSDIIATQQRKDVEATANQAQVYMANTQSALATSTWVAMTMTAIPPHATLTQMAVDNQIVLNTQEVAAAGLKLKQQQDTNVIQWLIPTLFASLAAVVGAGFVFNYSRVREVKNGDGDVELVFFDNKKAIRPKLLPKPVLELVDGIATDVDPKEQAEVTKRAQAVEALAAMPVSPTGSGVSAFNQVFGQNQGEPFEIVDGDELPPAGLLDGETLKTLNKDWTDANEK